MFFEFLVSILKQTFLGKQFCLQVQSATNVNQKEKYEAELKREIKKLQVSTLQLTFSIHTSMPEAERCLGSLSLYIRKERLKALELV